MPSGPFDMVFFKELRARSTLFWVKRILDESKGEILKGELVGSVKINGWLKMEEKYKENKLADSREED